MTSKFQQRMNNPLTAWVLVLAWVSAIYGTLYRARPICEFLRSATPLGLIINVTLLSAAGFIVFFFYKKKAFANPLKIVLFLLVLTVYALSCYFLKQPEERLHFIEYGLLTLFCFNALRFHFSSKGLYVLSWTLVTIFGYGDEVIQYYLPNRYFQWKDVGLNSLSAMLAVALILLIIKPVQKNNRF
ncbi:MAG: VanZ family protein [Candidatus Omnitrophica bacterium]|nr:VanZ family protein [Candidatus Omnitrophota bacterium]